MKKYILVLAIISSLIFFQTAVAEEKQEKASEDEEVATGSVGKTRVPEMFGTRQIENWYVIDNETIIIDTYGFGKFKATFAQPCPGIRFTDTIGFLTQGPYAVDKTTSIMVSTGEICQIKELVPYKEEEK